MSDIERDAASAEIDEKNEEVETREESKEELKEETAVSPKKEDNEDNDDDNQDDNNEDDDDDGLGLFGDEDEDEDGNGAEIAAKPEDHDSEEEIEEPAELKTLEILLVRDSKSHLKLNDENIKLQVPTFIGIDSQPFDPTKFTESVLEAHGGDDNSVVQLDDKVILENTIRWRYSTNEQGDVYRQSNTQIIEWDDGTFSLRLGGEMFDLRMTPNEDNFLVMTHDDQDILQTQEILNKVAKIVPTSTSSLVHKRLTKAISNRQLQAKQHKMKAIILTEDPELRIKLLEKLEEESIKARRRAELKRLHEEEKFERGSPAPSKGSRFYYGAKLGVEDEDEDAGVGIDVRRNEYDDEDGFIDDDEEDDGYDDEEEEEDELDKAAERLRKVKQAGAEKYKNEDEEGGARKKRRIISDDDDE